MHTSVSRRQRHRLATQRRRPRANMAARATIVALPAALFAGLVLIGLVAATGSVAAYSYFAQDLPDPKSALDGLTFSQQTVVYDRAGTQTLARFGTDRREVVTYDEIPPALIDATTTIEDKTFWDNPGFDPAGFVSAALDTLNGNDRGGSTITQQLVRGRLLPADVVAPGADVYVRKVKEIIQSVRLTQAYPGEAGKRTILEKYLNNNFYGNRTYGVKAAAKAYFGKKLSDLTLAEMALLAGIPQAPTRFDLVKNAEEETYLDAAGKEQTHLVVPESREIVQRRNFILDLMKTRSVLTAGRYTDADYEAAKAEPVVLSGQASQLWVAPQFVWQVRDELGRILCGSAECEEIDTGGYHVITTLDLKMQRTVEKWVYAAAIAPNSAKTNAILKARGIPRSEWEWINGLRGHNLHNAAAALIDYRTGEIRAYAGSASYTAKGNKRFQPQFDVLSDGWRQPGSSIKPLGYAIGIQDRKMTAATLFMDVTTNFGRSGGKAFIPTQADGLERGPVRLRSALEFSLNIPAIKAGYINGLKHQFDRTKDFGLRYPQGTAAVPSESIGTLVIHPIDLLGAYGALANGGVLVPHHTIQKVLGPDGRQVWPTPEAAPAGKRVVSAETAYVITDILAGNTNPAVNPFWGKWRITDGVAGTAVRPAAYKTGTTSDNRDVHAYGYLAPPSDPKAPALAAGVWMGNSNNEPNDGRLSLDTSAPLWSAILSEVSKGQPIERFERVKPKTLVAMEVDAFTGLKATPTTAKKVPELFLRGTEPKDSAALYVNVAIDAATGLRWQNGCIGPRIVRRYVDLRSAEANFKSWQSANANWLARARSGPGVVGPLKGTKTSYFYGGGFYPFGRSWGTSSAPGAYCPVWTPPVWQPPVWQPPVGPPACVPTPGNPCGPKATAKPVPTPPGAKPTPKPAKPPKPTPKPTVKP